MARAFCLGCLLAVGTFISCGPEGGQGTTNKQQTRDENTNSLGTYTNELPLEDIDRIAQEFARDFNKSAPVFGVGNQATWVGNNTQIQKVLYQQQLLEKNNDITKVMTTANNYLSGQNVSAVYTFYRDDKDGKEFANTYAAKRPFTYNGASDTFVEFFFQAEKIYRYGLTNSNNRFSSFNDAFLLTKSLKTGGWGTFPGTDVRNYMNAHNVGNNWWLDWDKKSLAVMAKIHAARFKGEPELFLKLVSTKANSVIIEDSPHDANWGRGGTNNGKNILGLLYMLHRERFWSDFKAAKNVNFDSKKADDVKFMLEWLNNYDGGMKVGVL